MSMNAEALSTAGIGLAPGNDVVGLILQIGWLGFFVFYMFYGQRLQIKIMLKEIESSLYKLQLIKDQGRTLTISTIKEVGKTDGDLEARVDRLLEHLYIPPVELDPSGIIRRLEHIVDIRDFRFKDEVKMMVPQADETQVNNLTNMIDAALALNQIYKIVKHFYLSGKKTSSFYIIMQLQMILPDIMKESEAYASALNAFKAGQPIGDGIGALAAAKLMNGNESHEIARDVVMSEVQIEGRTATF